MARKQNGFILNLVEAKLKFMDFVAPFGLMIMRIWVALAFWQSGLTKIKSWDSTLFLFEEEYRTFEKFTIFGNQFLTVESSAILATAAELILPILLILGLGARHAAIGLLAMTYVLEKTYTNIPAEDASIWAYLFLVEHLHTAWGVVLSAIILMGAGRFSWDFFIRANYFGFPKKTSDGDKLIAAFTTVSLTIYAVYLIISAFFLG